ncbi:signal peptidase I [Nostoc calcicola FACHB-389]|nr:signal peptidase I [Nostoc calcicola FACHB-3891]OKH34007.1 signal peptidase I [Nostoc calcicola FACHB-389]
MRIDFILLTFFSIVSFIPLLKSEISQVKDQKLLQKNHTDKLSTKKNLSVDGSNIRTLREIFEIRWIPAGSMETTLYGSPVQWNADYVLVDKFVYNSQLPKRGDIIIFKPTEKLTQLEYTEPFIKRIIALPGEKVELRKGKVYINNQLLQEKYLDRKQKTTIDVCASDEQPPALSKPQTLPPNSYLTLGDNRTNSYDSRCWGFVPKENIIGRVVRRVWPLESKLNLDETRNQQQYSLEELFLKNVGFIVAPNNLNDSINFFQKYLGDARKNRDIIGEITALRHLSLYSIMLGYKNDRAMNYSQQLLNIARKHKISGAETQALAYMSLASFLKGDPNLAIDYGQQVLPLVQKNEDDYSEYTALLSLAIAHVYLNDCSKYQLFYSQSLSVLNRLPTSNQKILQEQILPIFEQVNIKACLPLSKL